MPAEPQMRLKASIWVGAYVRQLNAIPVSAMITRRGDPDAGAIFIKVNLLDGLARVLRPALAPEQREEERFWTEALAEGPKQESVADAYLARQADFDSDIWIVEIEDREGRHFLGDLIVKAE